MYKNMFTQKQIKALRKNKNVSGCTPKAITYHPDFKVMAVRQYYDEGIPPAKIFTASGFNLAVIGANTPKDCLRRWRKTFRAKGADGLLKDNRGKCLGGGRPKAKMTDKEKIEYLEAKVAYLKAENDFLAKLRAAKKE